MARAAALLVFAGASAALGARAKRPNFVFLLTDDQDRVLGSGDSYTRWGSLEAMPALREDLMAGGTSMENYFVATPICCPSRAETFQGRYLQNLRPTKGGPDCMHADTTGVGNLTGLFGRFKSAGYQVGVFGKVTNNQAPVYNDLVANRAVSFINSASNFNSFNDNTYIHYDEANGTGTWNEKLPKANPPYGTTYQTTQIGNRSLEWLDAVGARGDPFFLYLGPHAPHYPATPAPWYADSFPDAAAPRTPNYNQSSGGKPAHIAQNPPMTDLLACWEDEHFRDRWRSLRSVDDLVRGVTDKLRALDALDDTYFFYSSDHGYKLGQWRVPTSKQHPYDTDIRVPLIVRGPGVAAGAVLPEVTGNVDLLPTMLELAGLDAAEGVDGRSFAGALLGRGAAGWREQFLIAYRAVGTYYSDHSDVATGQARCGGGAHPPKSPEGAIPDGECTEGSGRCWMVDSTASNTWRALRTLNATHNTQYVEYDPAFAFDSVAFREYYDLSADPYQMTNLYPDLAAAQRAALHAEISEYWGCRGALCP